MLHSMDNNCKMCHFKAIARKKSHLRLLTAQNAATCYGTVCYVYVQGLMNGLCCCHVVLYYKSLNVLFSYIEKEKFI